MIDNARYFKTPSDLRTWFRKNHLSEKELILGYYKVATKKPSITWSESVDQALCFGWIDGIRKRIDEERYCIRFTPRNPKSHWSAVNIQKIEQLSEKKLMYPAGISAYEKMNPANSELASYERKEIPKLDSKLLALLKANPKAWTYFQELPPGYKKRSIQWVMQAKREDTRHQRIRILIDSCEQGLKIPLLRK